MSRDYEHDPSHVRDYSDLVVVEDALYTMTPMAMIDRDENVHRWKSISLVRVVWQYNGVEGQTLE